MKKSLITLLTIWLPWFIRRPLLQSFCGYQLHPEARIGLAWVAPEELIMEKGSRIGALTVVKSLRKLHLGQSSTIGRGNWITGYPLGGQSFILQTERDPVLILHAHSAITHRHIIDCTGGVEIGSFTIIAGYRSQILTHAIDLEHNRQKSGKVVIGDYCFVGTNCIILPGAVLPDCCALGAMSLLNRPQSENYALYAGVPARKIKSLSDGLAYFHRQSGYVV